MGLGGQGAKPLSGRKSRRALNLEHKANELVYDLFQNAGKDHAKKARQPWAKKDLPRWERVKVFAEGLTVTSGRDAGTKLRLRPWQIEFIQEIYREDSKGQRPVRTAILSLARKNGKTQLAAALALCHLAGPECESRGEIYACANDRFQSSKMFHEMSAMLLADKYLADRLVIKRHVREIEDLETGSIFAALSSEAKTKMGLSPSFVVMDELGQATDRTLLDAMDSALGARKSPLLMVISTQAADDHAPMSQLIDYGLRVKLGEIPDPSFHLTMFQAPLDANPWDPATWRAANPALGDFRSLEDVERMAHQAQRMPALESSFRNLILNQRVAAQARFIERSVWQTCAGPAHIPDGARVYAGLDLGSTLDMTALVLVHADIDGVFHVKPTFFLPGDVRTRQDTDHVPYELWIREGYLEAAGEATDPKMIALKIAELSSKYKIMTLGFDRWRMGDLKRELDAIGCNLTLVPHGQGFKDMTPAIDCLERLVVQKRMRHGGHPVLQWNAANAVITRDPAGNRKLDKVKSNGRIDGLVALAMAFSLALIKTERPPEIEALIG